MLEDVMKQIEAIDWTKLESSSGRSAERIPKILQQILSDDGRTRRDARLELWRILNGEYYVGTASPIAIPFLVELLMIIMTPEN